MIRNGGWDLAPISPTLPIAVYTLWKSRYIFTRRAPNWAKSHFNKENTHLPGVIRLSKELLVDEKVIAIVSDQLSVSPDEITVESSFIDDLQADSLDLVELGMKFEEQFGVAIPDEDYEKLRTVGDAIEYIKSKG